MTDLTGKTALVTGSVQGIGLAIAKALAGAGARVAVHGLANPEEAQAAVAEIKAAGAPDARFFYNICVYVRSAAYVFMYYIK